MEFGCKVPNNWGIEDPKALFAIGKNAEALGFTSVWVSEHIFNAGHVATRLGNRPYYEPLTTLAYLAAITTSIRLGTSVLVLPYHHPVNLAKVIATLDVFSEGRLNLGIGAGLVEEESKALGTNFAERGPITDEIIDAMKVLWTQEAPTFQSQYRNFSGLGFSPKPSQKPHPPIFVGGTSRPAIRRAARVGDWWHPNAISPERIKSGLNYLKIQAEALGRDPTDIQISMSLELDFPDISGVEHKQYWDRPALIGTPHDVIQKIIAYQDVGVRHIVLATMSNDTNTVNAIHELFAAEVMPAFKD
jgi:probable F420-dependent oxidoreductase